MQQKVPQYFTRHFFQGLFFCLQVKELCSQIATSTPLHYNLNISDNNLPGVKVGMSENHFSSPLRDTLIYRARWQVKKYAWVSFSTKLWVCVMMAKLNISHKTLTQLFGLVLTVGTPDGLNKLRFGQAEFLLCGRSIQINLGLLNSTAKQFWLDCVFCCKVKHLHKTNNRH